MKKLCAALLSLTLCVIMPLSAFAAELPKSNQPAQSSEEVIHFEDDSYLVITTTQTPKTMNLARSESIVSGKRTASYYNNNDELQWDFIMNCTFAYVYGFSARGTYVNCDHNIYNNSWFWENTDVDISGNTSYVKATFKNRGIFNIVTNIVNVKISASCNDFGYISYSISQ